MTELRAAARKFDDLKVRLVSAVAVGGIALLCIWLGGWWIAVLALLAMGAMIAELWDMVSRRGTAMPGGRRVLALGVLYVCLAGFAFVWLRAQEPYGLLSILWAAAVVVSADVGGYFAGRLIGGPKLWPAVSPKKTWAGAGRRGRLGVRDRRPIFMGDHWDLLLSGVRGVDGRGGHLAGRRSAESALKRHFDVKDASRLIPGHGGVLDRLDGHMAAILVAATVTAWRDQAVFIW